MPLNILTFATDPMAFLDALVIPSARGTAKFADVMADFQRQRFQQIVPALLAVANDKKPPIGRFWWEATKGASKDSDLACCLLWMLAFSKRPLDCQVGAADKDQAGEMQKAADDILRLNDWLAARVESVGWKLKCRATNSSAQILAADVAGSHGARPDVLICNELSHITKQEFAENLLDNAAKVPHGLVVVATNSGFTGTWQHRWRQIAEESDRWSTNIYNRPSPWLDDAEMEEAKRRNSSARYNRLWHGIWAPSIGDALDSDDIQAAINPNLAPGELREGDFYIGGLDLGIKHDHSALVVIAGSYKTLQLRLAYARNWKPDPHTGKVDLIAVEAEVLAQHRRFGFQSVGYDPYQAALMAQRLEARQVPMQEVTFTGANLSSMASTLLDVFRSRRLELYDHPALVADLGRLTIEEKSYGHRLSATRTEEGHADLATGLAIALPIAVELAGKPPVLLGSAMFGHGDDNGYGKTPYEQETLKRLEADEHSLYNAMRSGSPVYFFTDQ